MVRRRSWSDPVAGGLTSGCGLHTYEVCGLPSRLALGYRVGALSGRGAGVLHFFAKVVFIENKPTGTSPEVRRTARSEHGTRTPTAASGECAGDKHDTRNCVYSTVVVAVVARRGQR